MPHVDLILPGPGGPEAAPHRTQNAQRAQRPRQNVDRDESRAAIALRPFLVAADALAYSHVLAREHLMPHDIAELDFQCLRAIFPTIPAAVLLRLHRASKEVRAPAEEALMAQTMSREVKIALLRNTAALADAFGREGTHNFLLPYWISFMNEPAWEVRAAYLEEAANLPQRVGQVATEGLIWPCYEKALLDQEERVVEAALRGLKVLVSQGGLRRTRLVPATKKVAPLLVHPSELLRGSACEVVQAMSSQLSDLDQYVFLLPAVQPYLLPECGLSNISGGLATPLGRLRFKSSS
eukprot:s1248_g1.t1